MNKPKEPISKISRPKLAQTFYRNRLFKLLDKSRRHPIVWVSGPGGAGKTTLVASYLASKKQTYLWYQVDARDTDPATFVYYMHRAVSSIAADKAANLPLFTPECMLGLDQFSLHFFEGLFQSVPNNSAIVLDNFQLLPHQAPLTRMIINGLSIIPDHISVILVSRENPLPEYSGFLAKQAMIHIGWPQIRLTQDETAGIVQLQMEKPFSDSTIRHLHSAAGGWAAGLLLMLAQSDVEEADWQWLQDHTPQEIFDYLGKEVFEREDADTQEFLLQTALLPHITVPVAKKLTGNINAGQILSEFNRSNRFTERRFQQRLSYQFHPLFREFLLLRCKATFTPSKLKTLYYNAAVLLQKDGEVEEAAILFGNAQAWEELTQLIIANARAMLHQGRNQTLLQWIKLLPENRTVESPWLGYWQGIALMPFDPAAAAAILEPVFTVFEKQNDVAGIFLSWAGITKAIFINLTDLAPYDHWIAVLERLMAQYHTFPNREIEGVVVVSMMLIISQRQLHHHNTDFWLVRAHALLSTPLDVDINGSLTNNTAQYYLFMGEFEKAAQLMALPDATVFPAKAAPKEAVARIASALVASQYYCYTGMHDQCREVVLNSLEVSKKSGFFVLNQLIVGYGIWSALIHEDLETAKALFNDNIEIMAYSGRLGQGLFEFVRALEALGLEKYQPAVDHASFALNASRDTGSQSSAIFCLLLYSRALHESGHPQAAAEQLREAVRLSTLTGSRLFRFHALLLEARFALASGRQSTGLEFLADGLALGNAMGLYHNAIDSRDSMTRLFATALKHGIEEAYVCEYIRRQAIVPDHPPVDLAQWPWPLKIYTLGRFSILKADGPIRFSTKAQKKPLEMIKVLIALGGREVNKSRICDLLWPSAEGDKAGRTFATTLHRLRHLLGSDLAVQIQDGKLSLNPACCWVDCWAFERLLSQAEEAAAANDRDQTVQFAEKALAIYKGAFLVGEEWASWSVSLRDRLQSRFVFSVNRLCRELETRNQWEKAIAYYYRSLEVNDPAESTYQSLMRCLLHLDRKSEALAVYHRCKTNLKTQFGLAPSPETQSIYQSIKK